MFVIMGAAGHVGSEVANALLDRDQRVAIVTRDPAHGEAWLTKGAVVVKADINEPSSLRAALRSGRRAFILNPPGDIKGDTDAIERRTVADILAALADSGLEKVVAESTAGAAPGDAIGDSSVLWEFEQGLERQSIPTAINRAAFYMSNWDAQLDRVRTEGKLQSMYPADFTLPMVAPCDLGVIAADRLTSARNDVGIRYVEGPKRYSPNDVAAAFAEALQRPVEVIVTPLEKLRDAYRQLGFSDAAADAYARMTEQTLRSNFDFGDRVIRGGTTIDTYVRKLVTGAIPQAGASAK